MRRPISNVLVSIAMCAVLVQVAECSSSYQHIRNKLVDKAASNNPKFLSLAVEDLLEDTSCFGGLLCFKQNKVLKTLSKLNHNVNACDLASGMIFIKGQDMLDKICKEEGNCDKRPPNDPIAEVYHYLKSKNTKYCEEKNVTAPKSKPDLATLSQVNGRELINSTIERLKSVISALNELTEEINRKCDSIEITAGLDQDQIAAFRKKCRMNFRPETSNRLADLLVSEFGFDILNIYRAREEANKSINVYEELAKRLMGDDCAYFTPIFKEEYYIANNYVIIGPLLEKFDMMGALKLNLICEMVRTQSERLAYEFRAATYKALEESKKKTDD